MQGLRRVFGTTRARTAATSRSKTVDGSGHADATCLAKVVSHTCRVPDTDTLLDWLAAVGDPARGCSLKVSL